MENRIGLIGIVVDSEDAVEKLNSILHDYGKYIVGRMGISYRERNISVISVVIDAPTDINSSLAGKLGMITGISIKTVYSKLPKLSENSDDDE